MRTVKQVSDLTGISVRTLHYYDEIGLLKPSEITEAGYRLYDDESLKTLQQILFFKELDIPLKVVKGIISDQYFDKIQALKNQEKLLILKRDRLNDLIELINKTIKGENTMSFKEFDMSEYFNALEEFKKEHEDKVIKYYGSTDKYNETVELLKSNEDKIAKMAIKQYGSIKKYTKAMIKNLDSDLLTVAEQFDKFKNDCLEDKHPKLKKLYKNLVSNLSKDPTSKEIQQIVKEISDIAKNDYEVFKMNMGDDNWYYMSKNYLLNPEWIELIDKKYGVGASKFIGEALKYHLKDNRTKSEILYEKLTSDLTKDPTSMEIQQIVEEIAAIVRKTNELYKVDMGENYWSYMAECQLSNSELIKITDKNYGNGASKFIGEALKFYSENNKL